MKKLKTPEEIAPSVHEYLKKYCMGIDLAEPARRLALEFKTNINNIKSTCAMLRSQGVLIGICKRGYYIIDNIGELARAIKLYHARHITAFKTYETMMTNARNIFGDGTVNLIIENIQKGLRNGYSQKIEAAE